MVDWSKVDLVVSIEAMGLPLLAAVGDATGKPTVVIRKRQYGMEGEVQVDVATGYSQSTTYINDIEPGERILIVDDVISTGGTLEPILATLEEMGVILQDIVIAIEKGEGRKRLAKERPELAELLPGGCDYLAAEALYPTTLPYTHLRAHETRHDLVCRLLLETKTSPPHYACSRIPSSALTLILFCRTLLS